MPRLRWSIPFAPDDAVDSSSPISGIAKEALDRFACRCSYVLTRTSLRLRTIDNLRRRVRDGLQLAPNCLLFAVLSWQCPLGRHEVSFFRRKGRKSNPSYCTDLEPFPPRSPLCR